MSSNISPQLPKHRIEFTGNAAPKRTRKPRKPPPRWLTNWFGGLLLFVVGAALGGFAAFELIWRFFADENLGGFFGALAFVLLGTSLGVAIGSIVGLLVWIILRKYARNSEVLD